MGTVPLAGGADLHGHQPWPHRALLCITHHVLYDWTTGGLWQANSHRYRLVLGPPRDEPRCQAGRRPSSGLHGEEGPHSSPGNPAGTAKQGEAGSVEAKTCGGWCAEVTQLGVRVGWWRVLGVRGFWWTPRGGPQQTWVGVRGGGGGEGLCPLRATSRLQPRGPAQSEMVKLMVTLAPPLCGPRLPVACSSCRLWPVLAGLLCLGAGSS